MLLLVPADSPPWILEAFFNIPCPAALLRTGGRVAPAFLLRFPLILEPAEVAPPPQKDDLVLVSLDYRWITWAKGKGLRAVWLNPEGVSCPAIHPLHDLEIRNLEELRKPIRFSLPDIAEALEILRAHGASEKVVRHSAAVAGVAHFLGEKLREKGVALAPLLAHRGGLLHDLDKLQSLEGGEHGEKAAQILRDLGYPALGEIARRHVLRPGLGPRTWEEKLVFYADKIVEEEEVVGMEGRLAALYARYPQFHREITAGEAVLREIQKEILAILGMSEAELLARLRELPLDLPRPFCSGS